MTDESKIMDPRDPGMFPRDVNYSGRSQALSRATRRAEAKIEEALAAIDAMPPPVREAALRAGYRHHYVWYCELYQALIDNGLSVYWQPNPEPRGD